jgi:diamine N-acetyltransferase
MTEPRLANRTIRVAQPEEAEEFAALCARTFVSAYPDLPGAALDAYVSTVFGYEQQHAELTDGRTTVFVVETGSELAGYVLMRAEDPPVPIPGSSPLAIARLYLEPDFRGQGLGSALLRHILDHAARQRHEQLWLTVWDQNAHARAVYESWGFVDVGTISFDFLGTRQIDRVMTRPLHQVG